jgi:uncharacterized membrane protein YjgN (DUF898 family)
MSCHIVLNTWSGDDLNRVVAKVAKVFRMAKEDCQSILQSIAEGKPWQFEYQISDEQAEPAASYLRKLGFDVNIKPLADEDGPAAVGEVAVQESQPSKGDGSALQMDFAGKGGELFVLFLTNLLKNIFTLGIYHFWAKTRVRQYLWSKTAFAGDHFSYHGTGMELLRGFSKFFAVLIVISGVSILAEIYAGMDSDMVSGVLTLPILIFFPALIVGAWRYRLSRTAWRGIRFSFRGKRMEAVGIYLKGYLLTFITFGIYWPYFKVGAEKFWRENSYFGDKKFGFTGEGKEVVGKYLGAALLTILTLGLYWIWFRAYLQRYFWAHTRVQGGQFKFTATGGQWFVLYFVNMLILVFSVGLGYPWVVARTRQFVASHLSLEGSASLDQVVQEMQKSGAFGEEALDAFDVPVDIG